MYGRVAARRQNGSRCTSTAAYPTEGGSVGSQIRRGRSPRTVPHQPWPRRPIWRKTERPEAPTYAVWPLAFINTFRTFFWEIDQKA